MEIEILPFLEPLHLFLSDQLDELPGVSKGKLLGFLVDLQLDSEVLQISESELALVVEGILVLVVDEIVEVGERFYGHGPHTPVVHVIVEVDAMLLSEACEKTFHKVIVWLLSEL